MISFDFLDKIYEIILKNNINSTRTIVLEYVLLINENMFLSIPETEQIHSVNIIVTT